MLRLVRTRATILQNPRLEFPVRSAPRPPIRTTIRHPTTAYQPLNALLPRFPFKLSVNEWIMIIVRQNLRLVRLLVGIG